MPADTREFQVLQLKALAIHYFSLQYVELEHLVKAIFKSRISEIETDNKNLLYFYLAGLKQSAHIDYGSSSLKTDTSAFSPKEDFASFSLSQIIKIQRQNHLLKIFDFTVPSINNKTVEYEFSDCCIKLINTRNKIAHELSSINFTDKEIVEILPTNQIQLYSSAWFSSLDTDLMDDETKIIFSSLIIMKKIIKLLNERGNINELKAVDNN